MRTVRCVSPHGGARHGLRADNEQPARPGYQGALLLEPAELGWVWNPLLGHVRVGDEADAPDAPDFIADGFHFVDAATGRGDACQGIGGTCWCGQHRDLRVSEMPPDTPPTTPAAPANPLAGLLGTENT